MKGTTERGDAGSHAAPFRAEQTDHRGPRINGAATPYGAASLADVMFDQLGYLLAHEGRRCPPECPECHRLGKVKDWLLLPFIAQTPRA